jgi:hypothetical protein
LVLIPLTRFLTAPTDDRADSARTRPDKKKSPVSLAGLNREQGGLAVLGRPALTVSQPLENRHPNVGTVRDLRDQQPSGNAREVTPTLENVSKLYPTIYSSGCISTGYN